MSTKDLKPGPLHEKCTNGEGCDKADLKNTVCPVYIDPAAIWNRGNCPMATHIEFDEKQTKVSKKHRVGQQKQIKWAK